VLARHGLRDPVRAGLKAIKRSHRSTPLQLPYASLMDKVADERDQLHSARSSPAL